MGLAPKGQRGLTSVTFAPGNKHFNSIEPQHLFHRQTYFGLAKQTPDKKQNC